MNRRKRAFSTGTMVLGAILTAMVVMLQLLATFTTFFGPFSAALALIPIIIGASTCGSKISTWLGLVFGTVVLLSGNATFFMQYDITGTIITVLAKGMACGLAAGLVHTALKRHSQTAASIAAALVCPIVNTGVFLLGGYAFFMDDASSIAINAGLGNISGFAVFWALAMANFLFEIGMNLVLCPVITRILSLRKKA